jgi:hypothetical protein
MSNKIAFAVVGALMTANVAWAGSQVEDTVSACTGINCAAQSIRGVHQPNEPFVIQLFSAEGECLRLDIDSQTQNMAMVISGPTVDIFGANFDRDVGDERPLIFQDPMPATGWYTLVISYEPIGANVAKFILKYGRYPTGNPNCQAPATASASAPDQGIKKLADR